MAQSSNNKTNPKKTEEKDSSNLTPELARWTIMFAFGGIALLGLCAITAAAIPGIMYVFRNQGTFDDIKEGYSNIKDILGILLPVMSAWAGTVFAFYFTKDNFKSASDSTAALVKQFTSEEKLKSTLVRVVMIKIDQADKLVIDIEPKTIKLKTDIIDGILDAKNRERLPMVDKDGYIKYMAHRSLIDKFIAKKASEGKAVTELTLDDMLQDPKFGDILRNSYCTVEETSSLNEAKNLMEKIQDCSDIFVTEDGTPRSKVIGWVTDVIVRQQATV